MEQAFCVNIRFHPQAEIVDIQGDLTGQADESLLNLHKWDEGVEGKRPFLILNLSKVPYINSAGIAILIRIVRSGRKGNFQTFAYGVSAHYQKLFSLVGLTEYMMIYPDEYSIIERIESLSNV